VVANAQTASGAQSAKALGLDIPQTIVLRANEGTERRANEGTSRSNAHVARI
jgi:hypothetical protein